MAHKKCLRNRKFCVGDKVVGKAKSLLFKKDSGKIISLDGGNLATIKLKGTKVQTSLKSFKKS